MEESFQGGDGSANHNNNNNKILVELCSGATTRGARFVSPQMSQTDRGNPIHCDLDCTNGAKLGSWDTEPFVRLGIEFYV